MNDHGARQKSFLRVFWSGGGEKRLRVAAAGKTYGTKAAGEREEKNEENEKRAVFKVISPGRW